MNRSILALVAVGLAAGSGAWLLGRPEAASVLWAATTGVALLPLTISVALSLLRKEVGVDVIALVAMAAALLLGEFLAGAVVALMLSGGNVLEDYAGARARRELSALVSRAPRTAHRYEDGELISRAVEEIEPGDRLLVKPGEVVPVDGVVAEEPGVLDESALTGEARPVERQPSERVRSGAVNAGGPLEIRAAATAEESTYAALVRLVEQASASKAPFVRLADRYALFFLPLTLAVAGGAWALSGDAVRALAVLVVATPCPLILAAPVAIVSGISRAARQGIIVKGGGPLEALARARIVLLDKTGTLTTGVPNVAEVEVFGDEDPGELLRLAASLDQVSPHVLAGPLVAAARRKSLALSFPTEVVEEHGRGIRGQVDGRRVALGRSDWLTGDGVLPAAVRVVHRRASLQGLSNVFVEVDGALAGVVLLEDPIRPDSRITVRALRRAGIERVVLVSGDHIDVAEMVGAAIGADEALGERSPADKVEVVHAERRRGLVVMVGDGINDAPALAAADVGVAMAARGGSASSEAADVVIVPDRLDRLAEALNIARRSRGIALESVLAGMGLSIVAMGFAAAGFIAPVVGALLQEGIDVAVIANALRALRGGRRVKARPEEVALAERLQREHERLLPQVDRLRSVADRLEELGPATRQELLEVSRFLTHELLPHEEGEDVRFYPVAARLIGGEDPTGAMSRGHLEITHLARRVERLARTLSADGPTAGELVELKRTLYGLHAILRLHFAQEEEHYFALAKATLPPPGGRNPPR